MVQHITHLKLPVLSDDKDLGKVPDPLELLLPCLERSPNVLSLRFVILSWNFTFGGSDSSLSVHNELKAFAPKASG